MATLRGAMLVGLLALVDLLFLAGLVTSYIEPLKQWTGLLLIVPATVGAGVAAAVLYRLFFHDPAVRLPVYPTNISLDRESGEATMTMSDGTLSALHIPEEVLEQGPPAVMNYIAREVLGDL